MNCSMSGNNSSNLFNVEWKNNAFYSIAKPLIYYNILPKLLTSTKKQKKELVQKCYLMLKAALNKKYKLPINTTLI